MEKSFSLEFNPLSNVKSVKDYELEIQKLKSENFELKTHLTHSSSNANLPQIIYEHNQKFAQLEQDRLQMANQLENMQQAYEQLSQEKRLLENKYNQDVFINSERASLLEDENKRLILRMEKFNKEANDLQKIRNALSEAERINTNYKNQIQNLENIHEQLKFNCNKQIEEIKTQAEQYNSQSTSNVNFKILELENLKKTLEVENNKNKNNILIINDLKSTLSNEISERNRLNKELEHAKINIKDEYMRKGREQKDCAEKMQKEGRNYLAGMEKFKSIVGNKLIGLLNTVESLSARLANLNAKCVLSNENRRFLEKLRIRGRTQNDLVDGFKYIFADTNRKMDVLKKETEDATFFTEINKKNHDGKTQRMLELFQSQFTEAKNELLICRKYLEKKAAENKYLKNENAKLTSEAAKSNRLVENARKMHDGLANKFTIKEGGLMM